MCPDEFVHVVFIGIVMMHCLDLIVKLFGKHEGEYHHQSYDELEDANLSLKSNLGSINGIIYRSVFKVHTALIC